MLATLHLRKTGTQLHILQICRRQLAVKSDLDTEEACTGSRPLDENWSLGKLLEAETFTLDVLFL